MLLHGLLVIFKNRTEAPVYTAGLPNGVETAAQRSADVHGKGVVIENVAGCGQES